MGCQSFVIYDGWFCGIFFYATAPQRSHEEGAFRVSTSPEPPVASNIERIIPSAAPQREARRVLVVLTPDRTAARAAGSARFRPSDWRGAARIRIVARAEGDPQRPPRDHRAHPRPDVRGPADDAVFGVVEGALRSVLVVPAPPSATVDITRSPDQRFVQG